MPAGRSTLSDGLGAGASALHFRRLYSSKRAAGVQSTSQKEREKGERRSWYRLPECWRYRTWRRGDRSGSQTAAATPSADL